MPRIERKSEIKGIRKGKTMKNYNEVIEEWKSVNGLEGIYEISNKGHVRSIKVDKKGDIYYKYLKIGKRNGQVDLYKDGVKIKRSSINQLMLEHFGIPTEKGEVWKSTDNENIKISNLGRVYNTRTAHFLEGKNVKATKMSINAFGFSTDDTEHWCDIEGYEGFYKVSDKGRVVNVKTGRFYKPQGNSRREKPYLKVILSKNGEIKSFFVHRLVAKAFVFNPNKEEWNQVNHKNEDKTDNRAENLEWCDNRYNINYGGRSARYSETRAKLRREKIANCKTEEEREKVLERMRHADYLRQWRSKRKNQ